MRSRLCAANTLLRTLQKLYAISWCTGFAGAIITATPSMSSQCSPWGRVSRKAMNASTSMFPEKASDGAFKVISEVSPFGSILNLVLVRPAAPRIERRVAVEVAHAADKAELGHFD